ncbi:hypothetical protein QFZ60_002390 [Arthrobacter sp. B2I5]|uniref:hypothetical protein n=1 Tax=Arthrobacter sp. B2I5 TaxID=3042266 RepID=UPI00278399F6|nr:hypothetical protein [Arthrobacter sp. B2I5]MDQ0826217.1 hypothetical protein [Arthrobacter sp. B2I5]
MPFFLEYSTDKSGGCFTVEGTNSSDAMTRAIDALRGMGCTSAALRQNFDPQPVFGQGLIIATYTARAGWKVHGE